MMRVSAAAFVSMTSPKGMNASVVSGTGMIFIWSLCHQVVVLDRVMIAERDNRVLASNLNRLKLPWLLIELLQIKRFGL